MKRRRVLASAGAALSMSATGCLLGETETEPNFMLNNIRSYLGGPETAIVVGRVEKQGDVTGNVTIRAELLIEDEYDHASIQTFVISEDVSERVIALPFTSDSPYYGEQTFTARAKIVRHSGPDGKWCVKQNNLVSSNIQLLWGNT